MKKLVNQNLDEFLFENKTTALFEIGEATAKSYNFSYIGELKNWEGMDVTDDHMIGYEFITEDNDKYITTFLPIGKTQIIDGKVFNVRIDFAVKGKPPTEPLNKGRMFKVFATVCNIIKDYLKRNPQTFSIVIIPGKTEMGKETRFDLYTKYIEKQLPKGWRNIIFDNSDSKQKEESSRVFQLLNDEKYAYYNQIKNKE